MMHYSSIGVGSKITWHSGWEMFSYFGALADRLCQVIFVRSLTTNGLDSALGTIEQTFDGNPLYPTINILDSIGYFMVLARIGYRVTLQAKGKRIQQEES
jgi:hypothetical protein